MDAPGTIPSWFGTEVRDDRGVCLGVVAALEFAERSPAPSAIVVRRGDGVTGRLPAAGMRCAVDHVVVRTATFAPTA